MNKVAIFIFTVVWSLNLQAQKGNSLAQQIEAAYKPVGNTGYFANSCECTVAEYQKFLSDPSGVNERYRYDSTNWGVPGVTSFNNDPLTRVYYNHPAYQNYPINNVSQTAAQAYCEWLTNAYNADPKRKYKKVVFRLPTESEWNTAALGNNPDPNTKKVFPWHGLTLQDKDGKRLANYAEAGEYNIKRDAQGNLVINNGNYGFGLNYGADNYIYTSPCNNSFPANDFGLHNMSGNVAEFTQDMGKTKGGSYVSPGYYLMVQTYDPEFSNMQAGASYIGFRPFMFIIEK